MSDLTAEIALLAAHPLELAPLSALLGPGLRAQVHGRWIAAAAVGVGMAAAGAGTVDALRRLRPTAALLLGSYGHYPGSVRFQPHSLLVPSAVVAVDEAVATGRAAIPDAMPARVELDAELCSQIAAIDPNVQRSQLATTLAITTDDALARLLGERSGCTGENLEGLAVALAAARCGVRFAALLGCTNEVGSRGRGQWREHAAQTTEATVRAAWAWLQRASLR